MIKDELKNLFSRHQTPTEEQSQIMTEVRRQALKSSAGDNDQFPTFPGELCSRR
jgi:hypothetical protein